MLAQVVLVQQLLLHGGQAGGEGHGVEGHERYFLQHHRVVHRLVGVLAPGKGTMVLTQHRRNRNVILSPLLKFIRNEDAPYAFAVVVEEGGSGAGAAGNVAAQVLNALVNGY